MENNFRFHNVQSKFIETSVWALGAVESSIRAVNFRVNIFMDNLSNGNKVLRNVSTFETSHVYWYRGLGGLTWNNPFINLEIKHALLHHSLSKIVTFVATLICVYWSQNMTYPLDEGNLSKI